ncbi:unnamed protein product [Adineta ricciae]|uniref:Uncharacterized protein n=1 Tax=Adineta ricciae TaxID=249248 RepID=A0A815Q9H9_ADIRI|nr:unnamed protein product [Adineta ricciae]CAF1630354.1 unnamed protein product [Adineta ricciae]
MAETTTERAIDGKTLQSSNLKILNNFDDYLVAIVGIEDKQHFLEQLPTMLNNDRFQSFDDIKNSPVFVHSELETDVFLIISGTLGKQYRDQLILERQLKCVYVYCKNESYHIEWTKEIKKIRCVTSDPTTLIEKLHKDVRTFSNRWPFDERSFIKSSIPTSQWFHLFLTMICHTPDTITLPYDDMFNECRSYYKNNQSVLRDINSFAENHKPVDPIKQYTRNGFLYRILNHALRTRNMGLIRIFSPFIRHLHGQLWKRQSAYYKNLDKEQLIRSVYRGQYLTEEQVDHLYSVWNSNHPIITLTTFGSTSRGPNVAFRFALPENGVVSCLFEIIITDNCCDSTESCFYEAPVFADITSISEKRDEREVLFSLVTRFRIIQIERQRMENNDSLLVIILKPAEPEDMQNKFSASSIIEEFKKLEDAQVYKDILDMLQETADEETKFNSTNWTVWWNNLKSQWHQGVRDKSPLNLIFFGCFTNSLKWSRKAIDMHKDSLRTVPSIELNRSCFRKLYEWSNALRTPVPTRWLALYEEYLEKLCTTNTKEARNTVKTAAETYEKIGDTAHTNSCYEKLLALIGDTNTKMKKEIEKKVKRLENPSAPTEKKGSRPEPIVPYREPSKVYKMQEQLWMIYESLKDCADDPNSIKACFTKVNRLLRLAAESYDAGDSRIILRMPVIENAGLSVNDYRFYCLLSTERHTEKLAIVIKDGSNNHELTLWRYEKYMHGWIFLGQLKHCLVLCKGSQSGISLIDRLMKKLNVVLTMCAIYLCVKPRSKKVNVDGMKFVNVIDEGTKQHIFGDIFDDNLLAKLQALEQEIITGSGSYQPISDSYRESKLDPTTMEPKDVFSDP